MADPLHTGTNSGSFGNIVEQAAVKRYKEKKTENKAKLMPAYEVVVEHIDSEIARVSDLSSLIHVDELTTPEELHREVTSRQAYVAYLRGLKQIMTNIVREK